MKYYITILILAVSTLAGAQSIKKGYKDLEKKEYSKARDDFRKSLSSDSKNVGANFGMALILADDNSPYFDVIDSWEYIEKIQGRLGELSQEDIEIIGEYFMNTEVRRTSRPVKKKMEIALEAIENRLIKYIREENDLQACYEVLDRYPNFRHYDNVVHIRNQFEFRKYEKMNTLAAYDEFIKKFPDAAQVPKAQKQRYKLAFTEAKAINTVSAYVNYIVAFPESEYLQAAIKLRNAAAYKQAKDINTLQAYEKFIETYPDALEVSEARVQVQNLLYEQAKRIKSLQAFNDFIKNYPDGQYFVDIFNLKASELGAKFISENNMQSGTIQWAKGFDYNGRLESGGIIKPTPNGNFVIACNTRETDESPADAWVVKIDGNGKMLWNKTIGQAFEDSISNVHITSKGDVIVVGYTYLTADSTSKKGWMFKLAADGKKLWNKNLGNILIQSSAIDEMGRIYIGGGIAKDTLGLKYAVTTFTKDAKKIGQKVYTGYGCINDIEVTSSGDLMLYGSNWITSLMNKRYINWDAQVDTTFTVTHGVKSPTGCYISGYNKETIIYGSYSDSGTENWFQNYPKSDSTQVIKAVAITPASEFVVLEEKTDGGKIKVFAPDGKILHVKQLGPESRLEHCISGSQGTMLVLNNHDLIVIRLSDIKGL